MEVLGVVIMETSSPAGEFGLNPWGNRGQMVSVLGDIGY